MPAKEKTDAKDKKDAKDAKDKKDEKKAEPKAEKKVKVKKEADDDLPKGKSKRKIRKENLRAKLVKLLTEFKSALIVNIDNVGSNQMQKVRLSLRGKAVLLMGKNTLIRSVIRERKEQEPHLQALLPYVKGNMGFVFTNGNLQEVRKVISENKVPAPAKSGAFAPSDVKVQPGPTGLDPGQTAFFQALNIATKIARGAIEIVNEVHLIRAGDKVTSSAVALLTKLNIKPFFFGIKVQNVYESGSVYAASVLDLAPEDLYAKFFSAVAKLTAISLEVGYPTLASLPHSVSKGFRKLVAISLETDWMFTEAKRFKEIAANPQAHAPKKEEKKEEKKAAVEEEEEEEEEEEDVGASGLFGDD